MSSLKKNELCIRTTKSWKAPKQSPSYWKHNVQTTLLLTVVIAHELISGGFNPTPFPSTLCPLTSVSPLSPGAVREVSLGVLRCMRCPRVRCVPARRGSCPSLPPVQSPWSSPSGAVSERHGLPLNAAVCTYVPEPVQCLLLDDCCRPASLEGKHICTLLSLCF